MCKKTFDANEVADEVPQRSNAASEQENKDLFKADARMLCPICLHPYKLLGFMYKHMQKVHPESFKLIADMLCADELLDGQDQADQLPMLCSEESLANFCEGSNNEHGSSSLPSSASDKENVVPYESQASSSREQQHVASVPSSLNGTYSRNFAAKKKGSTSSALKSHKENLSPYNQGKENVSPEVISQSTQSRGSSKTASADGCQTAPRPKRAKTDSALRIRSTGQKNLEEEVAQETFPPKKLLEQFRFLYLKGLYNTWLECANQQNHGGSNINKNENETPNVETVYVEPFLVDNGITSVDLASRADVV